MPRICLKPLHSVVAKALISDESKLLHYASHLHSRQWEMHLFVSKGSIHLHLLVKPEKRRGFRGFPLFSPLGVAARNSRSRSNDPNKRNNYSELQKRETLPKWDEIQYSAYGTRKWLYSSILWRSTCVKPRKNADVSEEDYLMMRRRCTRGTG